jgi:glycosyltransferase involved in cell wall biosynthesis
MRTKAIRVMHIFPVAKIGGAPSVVLELVKNTPEVESIVVTHCEDRRMFKEFERHAFRIFNVNTLVANFSSVLRVSRLVVECKPDILHLHGKGGAFYGFAVSLLLFKPCKIIYTLHGYNNRFEGVSRRAYAMFEKSFSMLVDKYVAVSASEKVAFSSEISVSKDQVEVIMNGVTRPQVKSLDQSRQLLLKKNRYNVVTLSRLSEQKDLCTMLHSFKDVVDIRLGDVSLHILGGHLAREAPYALEVSNLILSLGLEENVFVWGELERAADYLHCFDVYFTTALWEGLPTAVIEAMYSGLPVVGTNCRGNVDLIEDGVTGFLSKMGDPRDNAKQLLSCLDAIEDEKCKGIIDNAFQFVTNNCSIESYVNGVVRLYGRLLLSDH